MKKLLIVVDYQNDFVTGALGFCSAKKIENNIVEKIKKYIDEKDDIIFTLDTHEESYLQSREGKQIPIPHCIKNTDGWQVHGKIKNYVKYGRTIVKNTFGSQQLGKMLSTKFYDEIEFVGIVTHICVLANCVVAKTFSPESKIIVDSKCIADYDETLEKNTIDLLKSIDIVVI